MCRKCNGLQENAMILKYLVNVEVREIVFWRIWWGDKTPV